jgi:hypothetical protein
MHHPHVDPFANAFTLTESTLRLAMKQLAASLVLVPILAALGTTPAAAISVELAKKCQAMAYKAHPTKLAGVKNGAAQAQRNAYKACIANNGAPPADDSQKASAPSK